jgi:hypothetical protein
MNTRISNRCFVGFLPLILIALAPVLCYAELDCPALAEAMKSKTSWFKGLDFNKELEEFIKTSSYQEFRSSGSANMNLGVIYEGVPINLGASTSENEYNLLRSSLNAGRHLSITSHTRERFIEERLSDSAMNVLLECVRMQGKTGNAQGFYEYAIRHSDQLSVTLIVGFQAIFGGPQEVMVSPKPFIRGLTFEDDDEKKFASGGFKLKAGEEKAFHMSRVAGTGDEIYVPARYGFVVNVGNATDRFLEPVKQASKDISTTFADEIREYPVFVGKGLGGGEYKRVPRDVAASEEAKIALGVKVWPRDMADLISNIKVNDKSGLWNPSNGTHMLAAKDMWLDFSDVSWDDNTHVLRFKWTANHMIGRGDGTDVHIAVLTNIKVRVQTFP